MLDYNCPQCGGSRFWIAVTGDHCCQACRPPGGTETALAVYDAYDADASRVVWNVMADQIAGMLAGLLLATKAMLISQPPKDAGEAKQLLAKLHDMSDTLTKTKDAVRRAESHLLN